MRFRWLSFFICLLMAHAQEPPRRAVTVEDLFTLAQVNNPQISPDGKSVVYVLTQFDPARQRRDSDLWLVRDGAAPRPLTSSSACDSSPRWSPDGRTIAFLRTQTGAGADAAQVFLLPMFGGEAQAFTDEPLGVSSFDWSTDDNSIFFLARERNSSAPSAGSAIAEDENAPRTHLWRLDIRSGKKTRITGGNFHVREFAVSPGGEAVVISAAPSAHFNDGPKSEVYLLALDAPPSVPRQLTLNDWAEYNFAWRPDGSGFFFLAGADAAFERRALQSAAFFYSLAENEIGPLGLRDLAAMGRRFPGPVEQAAWIDANTLVVAAEKGTGRHIYLYDFPSGMLAPISRGHEAAGSFSVNRAGDRVAFLRSMPERPTDVWMSSLPPSEEPRPLTDHNPQVRDWKLAKFEVVAWDASDGVEIEGILWTPEGKGPWPVLTLIHGGPASADLAEFAFNTSEYPRLLAALGIATFQPNYRGSTNYGEAFAARSVGDRNGRDALDIEEGIDALIRAGVADPERLAVAGWSAGGVLTNALVTRSARFRAAISGAGVSDWRMQYFLSDYTYGSDFYFNGRPWERGEEYWERSPLRLAAKVKTPVLIHAGAGDERVPLVHSRAWFRALREHGVTTRLMVYPGEPHTLLQPHNQRRKIEEDVQWLRQFLLAPQIENTRVVVQTSLGEIEIEVDARHAPLTASNFLRYVDAGLYDSGQFHRTVRISPDNQPQNVVKIEVIQAGVNPERAKESFPPIPLERTRVTGLSHTDGAVSMARIGPDTAAAEFFICIGNQPELDFGGRRNPDGQGFGAFGRVVRGMDVVRKIHAGKSSGQSLSPAVRILSVRRKSIP